MPRKKAAATPPPTTESTKIPFVPLQPERKNLQAPVEDVDPADVEKVASLSPEDLKEHLRTTNYNRKFQDAVLKRHVELNAGKPKVKKRIPAAPKKRSRKKIATVARGEGGRMASTRTPIAPLGDSAPIVKPDVNTVARPTKKRRRTRSGKKLDKVTGKVLTPTVRTGASGKIEAIPQEERANITSIPAQEAEAPKPRERQRVSIVRGGVRPQTKGGAVSYPRIQAAVEAAMTHLSNMRLSQPGSDEHTNHEKLFDAIHANIKPMSPELHLSLGQAKHHIKTGGSNIDKNLGLVHRAITERLGIIKTAHEENIRRAQAGRQGKG